MNKVTVTYDKEANTLDVWFGSPQKAICEDLGNGIILKKNSEGETIGFEKLNFASIEELKNLSFNSLPVEVIVA
ncbi:MAG: DUF2283 domain-containing protein [Candidatus Muiribacteriota bacterium]